MNVYLRANFLLFVCILVTSFCFAQPNASFTASTTSGCSPLTNVQFTDQSTGNPTSWTWKRNGTTFSTLQNPTATFSTPGVYTIQLTATNSSGSSSTSINITVYANPTSNFVATSNTAGCLPFTASFQDLSTATNATITNRLWSFGDGGQSTATNPNHTYTLAGNFPVSLKVTDNHGCEDTKQIPNYIEVYSLPNASFSSSSNRLHCTPPLNVSFSNSSSGTGTLSYFWDFGDGNTSTNANPSHSYTSMGNYDVKLVVTDGNGCQDSLIYASFVQIQSITADFSASVDSICLGDSIYFTNNSVGGLNFNWNYGDNSSGIGYSSSHVYQDSGWFNVRLIASVPAAGCSDTTYEQVYVEQVVADFMTSPSYICELSDTVAYINNSVNWDYREWYRDIECPRNMPIYRCGEADTTDTVIYHIKLPNVERIYTDTLVVWSKLGCRDTMVLDTSVIVSLVRGGPILSQDEGCRPYTINFTGPAVPYNANVMVPNPTVTLTNFRWEIDSVFYSSSQNPPNLTVIDTGVWKGTYTVTNSLGCEWESEFSFKAGDSVQASFYLTNDTICVSDFDTAYSTAMDSNYVNFRKWYTFPSSGIGTAGGVTGIFNPSNIGSYDVVHIAGHNGCNDTVRQNNAFYAQGPIVKFWTSLFNCTDSTQIQFTSLMQQAARWYWNFGDSTLPIDSTSLNPLVKYSKKGVYAPTLTAYSADSMCEFVDVEGIIVGEIKARLGSHPYVNPTDIEDFSVEDTLHGCVPFDVFFTGYRSPSGMIASWDFGSVQVNGVVADSVISHTYNQRGFYPVQLVVFDTVANCSDTATMIVAAYKPEVDFYGDPPGGCIPDTIKLIDSVSTLNKIVAYNWQVGPYQDSNRVFAQYMTTAVTYNARLIVKDDYGCLDTLVKPDYVKTSSFAIDFYASNVRQLCAGDSIKMNQVLPTSNVDFTWVFNGDTAKGNSAWLLFPDSGLFDVTLIAIDTVTGCEKIKVKPNYVAVQAYPDPDFYAIPTDSTCYPLPVQFYADTNMPYFDELTFYYTLGDFSAASNYPDPFYNYVRPGSYNVSLVVTTPFGCKDTIVKKKYINIGGPYGEMNISPDSICIGDSVRFRLQAGINVQSFGFDFGDGSGVINTSPVWHTYNDSFGNIYPTLYFTDSAGGCAKTFTDTIYIFETEAAFNIIDTIGCVPFDPQIDNLSTQSNFYLWRFGDGTTLNSRNPNKIYNTPGSYTIFLKVKGNGCSDSTFKEIDVYPIPDALAWGDTLLCEGDSVQLFASGGENYEWDPPKELNDHLIYNPIAYPVFTVDYEVTVTDTNGCLDYDTVSIIVQNPIEIDLDDLVLIVGDTLTLSKAYGGKGAKYKWIPSEGLSCDTCPRPKLTALESGMYTVIITDSNNCFETSNSFYLEVEDKYTLDVPEAFTPNGDGVNDVIYVRGWGIKELITFKIFNRWGELIFESNDLSVGWDGTYKGELQGVETFAYYVEALTYGNTVLTKKGNINLLR